MVHRRPAQRGTRPAHHRGSQEADSEQADPVRGQHPHALRSCAAACGPSSRRARRSITHEANKPFLERVFSVAAYAQPRHVVTVETQPHVRDDDREEGADRRQSRDRAASHAGTGHHPGIIFAYLPKQKILFEGDGYNANVPANNPTPNPVGPVHDQPGREPEAAEPRHRSDCLDPPPAGRPEGDGAGNAESRRPARPRHELTISLKEDALAR